jgi:hypothetical protein
VAQAPGAGFAQKVTQKVICSKSPRPKSQKLRDDGLPLGLFGNTAPSSRICLRDFIEHLSLTISEDSRSIICSASEIALFQ